jgi:hypothetical protein
MAAVEQVGRRGERNIAFGVPWPVAADARPLKNRGDIAVKPNRPVVCAGP